MDMVNEKETDQHRQMRKVAFCAVAVSTAAVISAVITLPLLYHYVQTLQSQVISESEFCKMRSRDMWHEMFNLQSQKAPNRVKRGWLFGQWVPDGGAGGGANPNSNNYPLVWLMTMMVFISWLQPAQSYGPQVNPEPAPQCCTCQQGPVGPPGPPGDDGIPGHDGHSGKDGLQGRDGGIRPSDGLKTEPCVLCPPGPPGPAGTAGVKGPQGPRGASGENGRDGKRGQEGMVGPAGPMGTPGPEGPQGKKGLDGVVVKVEGPNGPPGPPGKQGPKGPKGISGTSGGTAAGPQGPQGDKGITGRSGKNGSRGPTGPVGSKGPKGDCEHCPAPRTPPGY